MSIRPIEIEGSLTIERVGDIQELMRAALARHSGTGALEMDLGGVTEFDGAGFQLLLAYTQAAEKLGVKVELNNIPENVNLVFQQYAVADRFANKEQP